MRKLMHESDLAEATKAAQRAEEERIQRLGMSVRPCGCLPSYACSIVCGGLPSAQGGISGIISRHKQYTLVRVGAFSPVLTASWAPAFHRHRGVIPKIPFQLLSTHATLPCKTHSCAQETAAAC